MGNIFSVEDHAEPSRSLKQTQLAEIIERRKMDNEAIDAAAAERLHDAANGLVFRLLRRTTTVGFSGFRFGGRAEFRKTTTVRAAHLRVETAAVVPATRKVLIAERHTDLRHRQPDGARPEYDYQKKCCRLAEDHWEEV
ncbi:MAG TPA: hypothetical protein P5081_01485 [Phycisphaerae bacterium]|nr:hypothetical protein [Phycisphaerae bacterium]HRW51527.1 hypothetical protein [Phycisphaerae bacterium]